MLKNCKVNPLVVVVKINVFNGQEKSSNTELKLPRPNFSIAFLLITIIFIVNKNLR